MFYKKDYYINITEATQDLLPEFIYTLYNKLKKNNFNLTLAIIKDNDKITPIILNSNISYYNETGEKSFSSLKKQKDKQLVYQSVSENQFLNFFTLDNEKLKTAQQLLHDFNVYSYKGEVKDKFSDIYELHIIENSDTTIGEEVVIDTIMITKKNIPIGKINVKYTNETILNKLTTKYVDNYFFNVATIDYSSVESEYQNKGLGYVLYHAAAVHLASKNIDFRASTLQSSLAEQLWKGIIKNFPQYIEYRTVNKNNHTFLKMGQTCLTFENQKPVLRKHII